MKLWPFSRHAKTQPRRRQTSFFGAGYEAVTSPYSELRRAVGVESDGEDKVLTPAKRARVIALARDMMRNSPTRAAQDQQLRVNVVGACGGKMYASFPAEYADAAEEVMDYFNKRWFPRAEFTFRRDFNWMLKTILTAQDVCGDVILVFDDGILTGGAGTGRIRAFEGDEIASVPRLEDYFPKDHKQSNGYVYNASGMFCGAFVSTSQRGANVFDPARGVIRLAFDPMSDASANWIAVGDMRRFNQGRPVSQLAPALTTLIDLHETNASEVLAAKFNAQVVGQVLHTAADETPDAGGFDDEVASAVQSGNADNVRKVVFDRLKDIGIRYQDMPEGLKMELFDTKRPNANMPAYIDYLAGLVGGVKGMGRVYATLKAQTSYTAFRGEQVMTWPSFEEAQKELERNVCDWAFRCVVNRAMRLGHLSKNLPPGWEGMIRWQWPKMREVSELDAARALEQKLRNGTTSLQSELPPGAYEKLREQRRQEAADAKEDGVLYPASVTASGQIAAGEDENTNHEEITTDED